jgi:hypothetical protein
VGDDQHRGDDPPSPSEGVTYDGAPWKQAEILRALADRLERGDPSLPTDVFATLAGELDLRRDDDAIAEAYVEQGERKAEPWVFCRGRAQG